MKKCFEEKRFSQAALDMLAHIEVVMEEYRANGYDLSLRQLYYQLVAANIVPNAERSYKNLGNLVSDARLAGLIDWAMISDRGRVTSIQPHWESPAELLRSAARQFRIDKWFHQPIYVEVMVEKQALEGVLEPVCEELCVPFTANKGYSSSSALYQAGQRMRDKILLDEKEVHVVYLGDHDPSGIDMSRDVRDRLQMFIDVPEARFELHRIALNMDQVEELKPPKNPAKITDSRSGEYIRKFGTSSWELDAIEPKALAQLVRDKVESLRDPELWDEALKYESDMRDELRGFIRQSKFNK